MGDDDAALEAHTASLGSDAADVPVEKSTGRPSVKGAGRITR